MSIEEGLHDIKCYLQKKDGSVYDMASVADITVSMSKNTATTLSAKLYRDWVTSENSESLIIRLDNEDFVWCYIENTKKWQKFVDVSAHDCIKFLVKNERTGNYGKRKCNEFTHLVLNDLGATEFGTFDDSIYELPEIVLQQTKVLDAIVDGINKTYEETGHKFFIYSEGKKIFFRDQENMLISPDLFTMTHFNCQRYDYVEDASNLFTSVKATSQKEGEDKKVFTAGDSEATFNHGGMQKEITVQDGQDPQKVAEETLKDLSHVKISLSASGVVGYREIRAGSLIYVDLYTNGLEDQREFVCGWFEVESVTHKFSLGTHLMDLECSLYKMVPLWEVGQ